MWNYFKICFQNPTWNLRDILKNLYIFKNMKIRQHEIFKPLFQMQFFKFKFLVTVFSNHLFFNLFLYQQSALNLLSL